MKMCNNFDNQSVQVQEDIRKKFVLIHIQTAKINRLHLLNIYLLMQSINHDMTYMSPDTLNKCVSNSN